MSYVSEEQMREIVKNINNCVYTQTLPARQKTRPDPKRLTNKNISLGKNDKTVVAVIFNKE